MSLSEACKLIERIFVDRAPVAVVDVRGHLLDRLDREGPGFLEVHLASLPRKAGRQLIDDGVVRVGDGSVDLSAWRFCDLLAADLLTRVPDPGAALESLYFQGDAEERRMILRTLPFLQPGPPVIRLMEEAHRTNDEAIFEAGNLDSDLASRLLPDAAYNRVVLKCAFLDHPKERLIGWDRRGNDDLALTLFDFMSEREAADRTAWRDTAALCALAPDGLRRRVESEEDPALRQSLQELLESI